MKKITEPLTIERIREVHRERGREIRSRLNEFSQVWLDADDDRLWEEMVYCFFTGGCSAKMGLNSVEAVRPLLADGSREDLADALTGVHRYPNERARYVFESREFLRLDCGMRLRERLSGFADRVTRRDWLAREKGIKGLGYKEASHFLRNIGFGGYAILDKHVLKCLAELKLIEEPKPPNSRNMYLTVEGKMRLLSETSGIGMDELDLVLWSIKTGTILK